MDLSTENKTLSEDERETVFSLLGRYNRFFPMENVGEKRRRELLDSMDKQLFTKEERESARIHNQQIQERFRREARERQKRQAEREEKERAEREKSRADNFMAEAYMRAYLYEQWRKAHRTGDNFPKTS
jgi:chromatin segregation and condensation protein Rec8/ScpA/Scc1 (kleisin family)